MSIQVGELVVRFRADLTELDKRLKDAERLAQQTGRSVDSSLTNAFANLGIRSKASIEEAKRSLVESFNQIKNSGTASARDIAAAQNALGKRLKELDRELNDSAGGFRRWGQSIAESVNSLKSGLVQGIGVGVGTRLTDGLVNSIGIIPNLIGDAVRSVGSFEAALNQIKIQGDLEKTPEKLKAIREEIDRLAINTSKGPIEIARLGVELIKTGFSADQVKDSLNGIVTASEATGEGLVQIGTIVGAAINQFGLSAKESTRIADVLVAGANSSAASILSIGDGLSYVGSTARANNQSLEDTVTLIAALANGGIDASRAGTNLQQAIQRLSVASAESVSQIDLNTRGVNSQAEALATLGVQVRDSSGKMRSLVQLLPELKAGFDRLTQGDQQIVSKTLFGDEGGRAILTLLGQVGEKFNATTAAIQSASGTAAATSAKTMAQGLDSANQLLSGSLEALQLKAGEAFAPIAESGTRFLAGVVNQLLETKNLFDGIKSAADEFSKTLSQDPELLKTVASGLQEGAVIVFQELGAAAKQFVSFLKENRGAIADFVGDGARAIASLTKLVIEGTLFFAKFHKEILLVAGAFAALSVIGSIVTTVQALTVAYTALVPVATAALAAMAANPLTWVAAAAVAVAGLAYVFRDELLPAVNASLSELTGAAVSELATTGDKFRNLGEAIWLSIKNPIDSLRNEWQLFLPELAARFRIWANETGGILGDWFNGFAGFIDGLKRGLDDILERLGLISREQQKTAPPSGNPKFPTPKTFEPAVFPKPPADFGKEKPKPEPPKPQQSAPVLPPRPRQPKTDPTIAATNRATQLEIDRQIQIEALIKKGVLTQEQGEIEKLRATKNRIESEIKLEREKLAKSKGDDRQKIQESLFAKTRQLLQTQGQIEEKLRANILKAIERETSSRLAIVENQGRSLSLANNALELEKQKLSLLDRQVGAYDALIASKQRETELGQALDDLEKTRLDYSQNRNRNEIDRLQRVREIGRSLSDSATSPEERQRLTEELNRLGYNGRVDELAIAKEIARLEDEQRRLKEQALLKEQAIARRNLESEIEQTRLAAERNKLIAQREIQSARLQSRQSENQAGQDILTARQNVIRSEGEVQKATSPEERARALQSLNLARQELALAEQKLAIVRQSARLTEEQAASNLQAAIADADNQLKILGIKHQQLQIAQAQERENLAVENRNGAKFSTPAPLPPANPAAFDSTFTGASTLTNAGNILGDLLKPLKEGRLIQIQPLLQPLDKPANLPAANKPTNLPTKSDPLSQAVQPILPRLDAIIKLLQIARSTGQPSAGGGDPNALKRELYSELTSFFGSINV